MKASCTPQCAQENTFPKRILTLDVFRGLTILCMILVNAQGTVHPYPLLEHARWHGGTLADLVFPFFLFIVGMTSVVVFQLKKIQKPEIYAAIFERSLIIFALGLFLNIFPHPITLDTLRVYGVLQRIALCYFVASIIYLNTSIKTQIGIFLGILIGYWVWMTLIPVPGFGANQLTEAGSWVAYVDQLVFSAPHLYAKVYDPEGIFSTLPSLATTLLGMLAGSFLLATLSKQKKCLLFLTAGLLCLILAYLWNSNFPINKNLWSSSFVLWSGGYALITFALCYFIIDILGYTSWALPLKIFGMNALFIFIFHVLLLKIQALFQLPLRNGGTGNLRIAITDYLFGSFSTQNAALFYAVIFIFLNFLVAAWLYKRKIFIRI